ncbi:MAG: TrkA C-terminal domain-containing protein [Methanomassiliicoccales archaeon]|jgi:uncharacterized protein with PhoU and TrkA domain
MSEHHEHIPDRTEISHTTVRELLTEMKDISEVMVDLAYAAIMFDSEEIAEEVAHLEERMHTLNYEIRIKAMLSARTYNEAVKIAGLLQVAAAAESISNAAGDIVTLSGVDQSKKPFLSFVLKEAEEKIRRLNISENSDMVSRSIADLSIESETGMRVIAIKRGKRWIYDPEDDTVLKAGDVIIVRGTESGSELLRKHASGETKWPVYPIEEGE